MTSLFQTIGYGAQSIGFGERAAVVVVDFQRAFTDPAFETGRSPHIHRAVERTALLVEAARRAALPIAACALGWSDDREMAHWKIPAAFGPIFRHGDGLALDARIHDNCYDFAFIKSAPSIFFGTPLVAFLVKHRVDTVIVTGCTTSGCVRASVVDSFSYGFRTIVAHDCCGDMEEASHEANLTDIARRYADVMPLEAVLAQIAR